MIRSPHERRESAVLPGEEGLESNYYHDPIRILKTEGPTALPSWYATEVLCCCTHDTVADLDRLYHPATASGEEGVDRSNTRDAMEGNVNNDEGVTNASLIRMRRAARMCLIVVAFFLSISQWSATASGVEFLSSIVGISEDTAAATTSALFSFCFLMSLVGGICGDYRVGSPRVLTAGLVMALLASVGIAVIMCPALSYGDSGNYISAKVAITVLLFLFSGALGLCQSSVPSLIGDQCRDDEVAMNWNYIAFYGAIQAGAFVARIAFPEVHQDIDWFVAVCLFMVLPTALAILFLALHSNTICYKVPQKESVALKAFQIAFRKGILCGTYEQLAGEYGWSLVESAVQAINVLKLHLTLPIFWALYFQMFELWYLQSKDMDLSIAPGMTINPEQATVLNPLFDVVWLILLTGVDRISRTCFSYTITAYTKMFIGYVLATLSFIYAVGLQYYIVSQPRGSVSIWHQLPQYFILAAAEILLYPAALQVAYVNAPVAMRNFIQSCLWFFIGIGNFIDMVVLLASERMREARDDQSPDPGMRRDIEPLFIVYAVAMGIATIVYLLLATWFRQSSLSRDDNSDTTLVGNDAGRRLIPTSRSPTPPSLQVVENGGAPQQQRLLSQPSGTLRRPVSPSKGVVYYSARRSSRSMMGDSKSSGSNTPGF